jgi:hypothetical protein
LETDVGEGLACPVELTDYTIADLAFSSAFVLADLELHE